MSKYIDTGKLVAEIEQLKETNKVSAKQVSEYVQGGIYGFDLAVEKILAIIVSLQQEQPDLSSGEDVMIMCNQILINWVKEGKTQEEKEQREQAHIKFFELYDDYLMQEQPEIEKEAEISPSMISNFGPCVFNLSVTLTQKEMAKMNIAPFLSKKVNVIIKDAE